MTFARLTRGDWLAAAAALALLLVMALDWYSTEGAEQARRDAERAKPGGALAGEPARQLKEDAQIIRNRAEKTAWQAEPFADRVVLLALVAAVVLAILAAWLRAADVRLRPPWTPSAAAAVVGLAAAVLLAARIIQKPEVEAGAVVKLGAPLGLACVGALAIGARLAWNAERDGSAWGEPATQERQPPGETAESGGPRAAVPLFDHEDAAPAGGATATVAAPAATEQEETSAGAPAPDQPRLAPAGDDAAWAPDWDDPSAREREQRRAARTERHGGEGARKRRRWPF